MRGRLYWKNKINKIINLLVTDQMECSSNYTVVKDTSINFVPTFDDHKPQLRVAPDSLIQCHTYKTIITHKVSVNIIFTHGCH